MADPAIIVVGGGLTGAATALALAEADWQVTLVESGSLPQTVAPDQAPLIRVSTLNPAVRNMMERLGAWQLLPEARVGKVDQMRVWERSGSELVFSAEDAGLPRLGNVVENETLRAALWQRLTEFPNVDLRTGVAVRRVDDGDRRLRVTLENGDRFHCALLLAADGARSPIRESAGIECSTWDYGQNGLVMTVETGSSHENTAWQRFLPDGPLAFLPLPGNRCSIVWSLPTAEAEDGLDQSAEELQEALKTAFEGRLGDVRIVSERGAFPLLRRSAERFVSGRVVLLGDAAHTVHPLAGQGANLGLLDAAALAEVLERGRQRGLQPDHPTPLRQFERWRRSDVEIMAESLHQLWFLYRWRVPPFPAARQFGTRLINRNRWLRRRLIDHASGFGGRVPRLAQPQV